jgi:hypothetical protein
MRNLSLNGEELGEKLGDRVGFDAPGWHKIP